MEYIFHDAAEGQHENVAALVGKIVAGVWALPDSLFIAFTDDTIVQIKPIPVVGFKAGLCINTGTSKQPGFDWHTVLDQKCGQPPQCEILRGLPFKGMDLDVAMFGDEYGIMITQRGIRFVRDRKFLARDR